MVERKGRKPAKKATSNGDKKDDVFDDTEVERQSAAIRALRDLEIEQLRTMMRFLRSYFSKEPLQTPMLQYFKENNLSIVKTGDDGQYEVSWKDREGNLSKDLGDETNVHASFLRQLSMAYPDWSAGIPSLGGFEFSANSVKTGPFCADKLHVLDEPPDSQLLEQNYGLQTPNAYNNNRLSFGMTPKTRRLPKYGEMLLSVNGSPLGVYKEDNMETIQRMKMIPNAFGFVWTFEHLV